MDSAATARPVGQANLIGVASVAGVWVHRSERTEASKYRNKPED